MLSRAETFPRALVRWAWPRGGTARGRRALARGKPLLALKEWMAASAAGSAESAYNIARLYIEGRGVIFSAIEARRWLEAAQRGGNRQAQFELGRLLLSGGAEAARGRCGRASAAKRRRGCKSQGHVSAWLEVRTRSCRGRPAFDRGRQLAATRKPML